MTNPTTPFSWQMPTSTDLVTDLPADFEVFGQAVATSMADLLGGTTGQILAKASNTDMDFTWIANDQGDITGVTASSPLTGGGTSGAITLGILNGTTSNLGAVQLSDSTSSTSTSLAATANAVKTTYDLANAAIPKSTVTTAGDVVYATGSSAVTRLGIGTAGQVLTVTGGLPTWSTPAGGGGKLIQLVSSTSNTGVSNSTNTYADTGLSVTITPTLSTSKVLITVTVDHRKTDGGSQSATNFRLLRGATVIQTSTDLLYNNSAIWNASTYALTFLDSPATTSATTYKLQFANNGNTASVRVIYSGADSSGNITAMEIGA